MASEWPAWVVLYAAYDKAADSYEAFSLSDDNWPWRVSLEKESGMYLHRDAARAWHAFMQWCDGTAEQWQELLESEQAARGDAYWAGYDDGQAVGEDRR